MSDNNDMFVDSVMNTTSDMPGQIPADPAPAAGQAPDAAGSGSGNTLSGTNTEPSSDTHKPQDIQAKAQGDQAQPQGTATPGNNVSAIVNQPQNEKKKFSLKEWVPGPQVPNQLTIARICMIPLFVIFILWVPKPAGDILAMITFIIASLTDTADGYIARRYNYVTTFGKFMDPLADKLLVCSALVCLVDLGRIESWIVIIIIAREFIISGFRLVAAEKGTVIAANIWGKLKTVFQMLMVILMVANFGGFLGLIAQILKWTALALTLISLCTYMYQNRHVLSDNV